MRTRNDWLKNYALDRTIWERCRHRQPCRVQLVTYGYFMLFIKYGALAALEQRREQTRHLKQAMMQELLTGRTRLI